jgi:hypothetical protein
MIQSAIGNGKLLKAGPDVWAEQGVGRETSGPSAETPRPVGLKLASII